MGEDPPTGARKSFWSTLPGILTASATALGAVTALVTALYTAGIIGQQKPDAKQTPPPVTAHATPQQEAAEQARRQKIDEASQQEQAAAETLRKAQAETERLRRELAAIKQKGAEARKQAALDAAKRKAEEAAQARQKAEAELDRLRRERDAAAETRETSTPQRETTTPARSEDPGRRRDATLAFRVVRILKNELAIDVDYAFDRSRSGPLIARAGLLFQGKPIPGYKLSAVTQPQGTARVQLVVRTQLGRQSDQLEVFLREDRERVVVRRFPFSRTFED
jgi:colicin import membrane protein